MAGLLLFLPVHSFLLYPLSLLITSRGFKYDNPVNPKTIKNQELTAGICMCAYNEEKVINKKLDNLFEIQKKYGISVYIYTDACSDNTNEIILKHSIKANLVEGEKRAGKSIGMNILVNNCKEDLVVFTDANSIIDVDGFGSIFTDFIQKNIGCVCGNLKYINSDEGETAKVGSIYWKYEEFVKKLETMTGSTLMADGALFAIRRKLFRTVPSDIIDDMYTSLGVLLQKYRVVQSENFTAYELSTTSEKEEYKRKIRIACRAFNCNRLLWSQIIKLNFLNIYKYISHKVLRWLTIYFLAGAFLSLLIGLFRFNLQLFLIVIVLSSVLFGLSYFRVPFLYSFYNILRAFSATGIGVLKSLLGEKFQTWTPPETTR